MAHSQFVKFSPRILPELDVLTPVPTNDVSPRLFDALKVFESLGAFSRATLYVGSPTEKEQLWEYTAWRSKYDSADGFAGFYPIRSFETAIASAIKGDTTALDKINSEDAFSWYALLRSSSGKQTAVLRLDGRPEESYGQYITQ